MEDSQVSEMPRERQFIVDVLRYFVRDSREPLSTPADLQWSWIGDIVSAHDLGPLFKEALSGQRVPESIHARWLKKQRITFVRNSRALSAAVNLQELLDRAEIPSAVVRGLSLAYTLYPEPWLRPMSDVDVLIQTEDGQAVAALLEREGLHTVHWRRSQLSYHINGTVFEVHWSLLNPKRYRKSLSNDTLLQSRESVDLPEGRIYLLSREDELLCLITHAFFHHGLDRLLPLVDMALLIQRGRLDWDSLAFSCQQSSLSRMHLFTLSLVNRLFRLGLKAELKLFGPDLPSHFEKAYQAYMQRFFYADSLINYLRRKRNLIHVAESPYAKFRQAVRLIAYDEMRRFFHALRR